MTERRARSPASSRAAASRCSPGQVNSHSGSPTHSAASAGAEAVPFAPQPADNEQIDNELDQDEQPGEEDDQPQRGEDGAVQPPHGLAPGLGWHGFHFVAQHLAVIDPYHAQWNSRGDVGAALIEETREGLRAAEQPGEQPREDAPPAVITPPTAARTIRCRTSRRRIDWRSPGSIQRALHQQPGPGPQRRADQRQRQAVGQQVRSRRLPRRRAGRANSAAAPAPRRQPWSGRRQPKDSGTGAGFRPGRRGQRGAVSWRRI